MDQSKATKSMSLNFIIYLSIGLVLLAGGIAVRVFQLPLLENNKAIVALSFIPLGLATYFGVTAALMKRNPKYTRAIAAEQSDERINGLKQRADSITYQTMRIIVSLVFFGYTFAFPSEIFESAGWWITLAFFFLAHMMQGIVLAVLMGRDQVKD